MSEDYALVTGDWAPFVEYDIARGAETTGRPVDQTVRLSVWGVPEEGADQRLRAQLIAVLVWYVHERSGAEYTEGGDIRFGSTPGFFRGFICECAGR